MLVDVYNKTGQTVGQIELADNVFGITPNDHVMHQAVVAYLANNRQGTKKTKVRSEVSGGGKKPWKQKGRGGARAGSNRSPLWKGGGTIHGPKPIDYSMRLPIKIKRLARKSAYSARTSENNLIVVEDFVLSEIKTKEFLEVIKALKIADTSVLMLMPETNTDMYLASRNIPNVKVDAFDKISAYDILRHKKIVLFKSAVEMIVDSFK
ncbi:MAG: 50S ribosomal protein L4 [Ignavibacteria bacterium]|jgi:large subunit ribosomal protein L4|nr:50S ribosomal protein L4 [Ignavibacteria bacterium]